MYTRHSYAYNAPWTYNLSSGYYSIHWHTHARTPNRPSHLFPFPQITLFLLLFSMLSVSSIHSAVHCVHGRWSDRATATAAAACSSVPFHCNKLSAPSIQFVRSFYLWWERWQNKKRGPIRMCIVRGCSIRPAARACYVLMREANVCVYAFLLRCQSM